jgi:hypothetical protein
MLIEVKMQVTPEQLATIAKVLSETREDTPENIAFGVQSPAPAADPPTRESTADAFAP